MAINFTAIMQQGVADRSDEPPALAAAHAIVDAGRAAHKDTLGDSGTAERNFSAYKGELDAAIRAIGSQSTPNGIIALLAAQSVLKNNDYFRDQQVMATATDNYINHYDHRTQPSEVASSILNALHTQGMDANAIHGAQTALAGMGLHTLKLLDLNLGNVAQNLGYATKASSVDGSAAQIAEAIQTASQHLSAGDQQKLANVLQTLGNQKVNSADFARISLFKGFLTAREMILNPGISTSESYIPTHASDVIQGLHINRDDRVPVANIAAAPPVAPVAAPQSSVTDMQDIAHFEKGHADLSAGDKARLDAFFAAQIAKIKDARSRGQLKTLTIDIQGSADGSGKPGFDNKHLAEQRAQTEAQMLQQLLTRAGLNKGVTVHTSGVVAGGNKEDAAQRKATVRFTPPVH